MQNISHVPIRIDWIVYDATTDADEKPRLVELIPVIDNNPFDSIKSETTIMDEYNDEIMSRTTISSSKKQTSRESLLPRIICFVSRIEFSWTFSDLDALVDRFDGWSTNTTD